MPNISTSQNIRRPIWLTVLRVILGLILMWKGIAFIQDTVHLKLLIEHTGIGTFSQSADALSMAVAILTMASGFFITVGLFTRVAAIVQIPIVVIAVFFVNAKNINQSSSELIVSILVLLLLILFVFKSKSFLSADEYFKSLGSGTKGTA